MQCHSTSIKSHQVILLVSPITTTSIVKEISERCSLINVCVVCLIDQRKQLKNVKDFRSNDIGTYLATLKLGT